MAASTILKIWSKVISITWKNPRKNTGVCRGLCSRSYQTDLL